MALVMTSFEAYGREIDEPLTKRFMQIAIIKGTGAATDVTYDIGTDAGTYWTAVGSTSPGSVALATLKQIVTISKTFIGVRGPEISAKTAVGSTTMLLSGTIAGGAASTAAVVTGLATTDVIQSVTQRVKGANSLPLLGWSGQVTNGLTVVYSADPGANGIIDVSFVRQGGTPSLGQYLYSVSNSRPMITFATANAPTTITLYMEWDLQNGTHPLYVSA